MAKQRPVNKAGQATSVSRTCDIAPAMWRIGLTGRSGALKTGDQSGTTAMAWISTRARSSMSALTSTTAMAGKDRPITSR